MAKRKYTKQEDTSVEENKLESMDEVKAHSESNPDVDTTVVEDVPDVAPMARNTIDDIAAKLIVSSDDNVVSQVTRLIELSTGGVKRILASMLAIISNRVTNYPKGLLAAQKEFSRGFSNLLKEDKTTVVNAMKYINWAYKELTNLDRLKESGIPDINKLSPLDPMNSMKYSVSQHDVDIDTFIVLITIIDTKSNPAFAGKVIDLTKLKKSNLTDATYEKLNAYYIGG